MKVHTVGGYNEVGKNMTAIESNDEIVIIDMGYDMEEVIAQDQEIEDMTTTSTIETGAVPDDSAIHDIKDKVSAIIVGHGHLDHVGAVPKLAGSYDCPIIATPFTMTIIKRMCEEDRKTIDNSFIELEIGQTYEISDNITLEFVNITHSIPGAAMTVLHNSEGTVAYSLDFRLDQDPLLGEPSDYERLKELGHEGVDLFIGDSTRVDEEDRGKSEKAVKTELEHTIDYAYDEGGAVFITTFSSHVERLNSILDANNGRRKVAFMGRSLREYNESAEKLGLIDLSNVELASYRDEKEDLMRRIANEREEWLVVATGNQGEPRATLTRIAQGEEPLQVREGDTVIFSSSVIPEPLPRANRYEVDKAVKEAGGRLIGDVHVSGHAKREDNRDMLRMLQPEIVIPGHGTTEMLASYATLAREEGYTLNEDLFICENGNSLELDL